MIMSAEWALSIWAVSGRVATIMPYHRAGLGLFLFIYADDFKMSGRTDNLAKGWSLLQKRVDIDTPYDISGQAYLGCQYHRREITLPGVWQSQFGCQEHGAIYAFLRSIVP